MKKNLLLLFIVFLLTNCSSDKIFFLENVIVGEWKLTHETYSTIDNGASTVDFSSQNIIYNFKSNGSLIITPNNNFEGVRERTYVVELDYLSGQPSPNEQKILIVRFDDYDTKWVLDVEGNKMSLGLSYVDGSDLFFERK